VSDSKIIHVKQFDGGRRTPAEYFREQMYAKSQCTLCGGPPAMRIRYMAEASEFKRREPEVWAVLTAKIGGDPTFPTKYGPMVHVESIFACDLCKHSARQMAAKKPDWVICEFEETGLEESHPTVVAAK
jgi:hypothetical protein